MTFADDLLGVAGGEEIEYVVIGRMGWGVGDDERHAPALARTGEVLSWDEARRLLSFDYSNGEGWPDCPAVYAYTANCVIFTAQYDGAVSVESLPRNPTAGLLPSMPGG